MRIALILVLIIMSSGCIAEQTYMAERIIDGDTFVLDNGDKVRLIGYNAPEIGEPFADNATERLSELVMHRKLRLERDVRDKDDYGRLLRYVYADEHFVNLAMLQDGYGKLLEIAPISKHNKEFEKAEEFAQYHNLGIWSLD